MKYKLNMPDDNCIFIIDGFNKGDKVFAISEKDSFVSRDPAIVEYEIISSLKNSTMSGCELLAAKHINGDYDISLVVDIDNTTSYYVYLKNKKVDELVDCIEI